MTQPLRGSAGDQGLLHPFIPHISFHHTASHRAMTEDDRETGSYFFILKLYNVVCLVF